MIEIVPTVVPKTIEDIVRIASRYRSFAKTIHVDVADGIFAPNTTWMPNVGDKFPEGVSFEIHLMVSNPHAVGVAYAKAGATSIIGHSEAFQTADNARAAFSDWKAAGVKSVQTAALFQTPLESVSPYVSISNFILLMTIGSIGVQGIPFEESGIERVRKFKNMHPEALIAVDGGVSEKNIGRLAHAGATHFCIGSALSKADSHSATYRRLEELATRGV